MLYSVYLYYKDRERDKQMKIEPYEMYEVTLTKDELFKLDTYRRMTLNNEEYKVYDLFIDGCIFKHTAVLDKRKLEVLNALLNK